MSTSINKIATTLKYSSILAKAMIVKTWDQTASRRYLLNSLGSMSGVSAKAAQFLAMRLGEAQSHDPLKLEMMPVEYIKAHIEAESPRLHANLIELSNTAKVASLGQVHQARLKSGETIAIKVQFPNLRQGFETHLQLLRDLSKIGPPKKFQFEIESLVDFFSESLLGELDYNREAEQQIRAAAALPNNYPICIAEVYPEYSTQTILVQSFEASTNIETIQAAWPDSARSSCAEVLLGYFMHAVFNEGLVHSDPHPGNFGFRPAQNSRSGQPYELVLYDFGSVMTIPQRERAILWQMIQGYQKQKDLIPFDYLVALGFDRHKLGPSSQKLPILMQRLCQPFCQDWPFDFRNWDLAAHFERVLGDDRWWFRSAGPAWLLMLMRATQGFLNGLLTLNTKVAMQTIIQNLDIHFQPQDIPRVFSTMTTDLRVNTGSLAKNLCVDIRTDEGEAIVSLELPAHTIDELTDLIPQETLQRMRDQNFDFEAMLHQVQKSGYMPQEIFTAHINQRVYRVWLQ